MVAVVHKLGNGGHSELSHREDAYRMSKQRDLLSLNTNTKNISDTCRRPGSVVQFSSGESPGFYRKSHSLCEIKPPHSSVELRPLSIEQHRVIHLHSRRCSNEGR